MFNENCNLYFADKLITDLLRNLFCRHVPLKSLAEMQWASSHLSPNDLVLSATDNFEIDPVALRDCINHTLNETKHQGWNEFPMICSQGKIQTLFVNRNPASRFYAPFSRFQWETYPAFCAGGFYLTGARVVKELYAESKRLEHFRDGGLWVTGLLRRRIGMPDKMMLQAPATAVWRLKYFKMRNAAKRTVKEWKKKIGLLGNKRYCLCDWVVYLFCVFRHFCISCMRIIFNIKSVFYSI